jgi:hypothetical protein
MYSLDAAPLYIVAQPQRCMPSESTAAAANAVALLSAVLLPRAVLPVAAGFRRLLPLVLVGAVFKSSAELWTWALVRFMLLLVI